MKKIVLKISYKGCAYAGWQVQQNAVAIQQVVQDAVEKVFGYRYDITGCSRTDSGVHAKEYFCHLPKEASFPVVERLPYAMNNVLPDDIAITGVYLAETDFHARYSALSKEYVYRIRNSRIRDPFTVGLEYSHFRFLDADKLNSICREFIGKHDFTALSGAKTAIGDENVRSILKCSAERDGDIITISVTGDGFLYNMVRIIVGTAIEACEDKLSLTIPEIIRSGDRKNAGFTAPACGLYLNKVFYPEGALIEA